MKGVGETLAGRASGIELETFTLKEIVQSNHYSENNKIPKINYPEYLLRGGYPELYKNINMAPADFYSSYTVTYLERDVKDLVNVNPLRDFERFIRLLEPWFSNKSKCIIKTPKIYFSDVGLLCFLLNIQTESELLNYLQLGAVWETFVFSDMQKNFWVVA
jgi:predicted AAA+ superfamily ATPase